MTKAFKCERCGEYAKGEPYVKLIVKRHGNYLREGDWYGERTHDLCEDCYENFQQEFMEGK